MHFLGSSAGGSGRKQAGLGRKVSAEHRIKKKTSPRWSQMAGNSKPSFGS